MAKQINLGKVKGTDATINGVTTLTITGSDGITATQSGTTLNLSAPTFATHASNTNNPHAVTKSQVGLGNVDNKSEATIIADAETAIMTSAKIETALGYTPADTAALATKQDTLTGAVGQIVSFNTQGEAIAVDNLDPIYGFEIDHNETNPASKIRYIANNAGFASAHWDFTDNSFNYGDWADAWFIRDIKVRLMKSDGTVLEELDPNNYAKQTNGSNSHCADPTVDGNVMVGIPTVWIRVDTSTTGKAKFYFAPYQVDSSYHAYAHINDKGEVMPYTYIAAYDAWDEYESTSNHKLRSISGKHPTVNQTGTNQIAYSRANNAANSDIWDMTTLSDRELIQLLCILIGKNTNSQNTFGRGNTGSSSASFPIATPTSAATIHAAIPGYPENGLDANGYNHLPSGTMDTCGLFWGNAATTLGVKVFGIENFWGNVAERTQGLVSVDGMIKAKLTRGKEDGSNASDYNAAGTGYIDIGVPQGGTIATTYTYGFISNMTANQYGLFMANLDGAGSSGYCDYAYNIKTGNGFAIFGQSNQPGGGNSNWSRGGIFANSLANDVDYVLAQYGTRLSLKP